MKKLLFLILLMMPFVGKAQEIIVKSFAEVPPTLLGKSIGDIPKTNEGEDAAIVVVKVHRSDISFGGRLLRDGDNEYTYENGEYTLYVAPRSKSITIKIPGFNDERVHVADYATTIPNGLQSRRMYEMYIEVVPKSVLGGRNLSWGISGGYLMPMIKQSSDNFVGSPINYGLGNADENNSNNVKGGFTFGVNADIRIRDNWYIYTGISYGEYTSSNDLSGQIEGKYAVNSVSSCPAYFRAKESYKYSLIEIPVYASYRFPVSKRSNLQIGLGPVLSYGLSAKMKFNNELLFNDINLLTTNYKIINYIENKGDIDLYSKNFKYQRYSYPIDEDPIIENVDKESTSSPLNRIGISAGAYLGFEFYGFMISVHYRYMLNNIANDGFWNGSRLNIFNAPDCEMNNYVENHNYLQVRFGYTLRY